jgi:hypothetical protein
MGQNNSGEIDLLSIYNGFNKIFNKSVVLLFRAINYILKNWIIVVLLIVAGIAYGYLTKKDVGLNKQTDVLLKVNFNAVSYVYKEVELFNKKLNEKNIEFIEKIGLSIDSIEVKSLSISPVINLKDIISNYGGNGRYLEGLLKSVEFNNIEGEISETFILDYNYHLLVIELNHNATLETIDKVLAHFNSNELLTNVKNAKVKNMEERILNNKRVIKQIDEVILTYNSNNSIVSSQEQIFVVDKNFNIQQILNKKIELQKENEWLIEELLYYGEIALMVNEPNITEVKERFFTNNFIFYPFLFVSLFLLIAFSRETFISLKKIALQEENKY